VGEVRVKYITYTPKYNRARRSCSDWAVGWMKWGSIPGTHERFLLLQNIWTSYGAHAVSCPMVTGGSFCGGVVMNLTTHPHVVPRLRMGGAVPLLFL